MHWIKGAYMPPLGNHLQSQQYEVYNISQSPPFRQLRTMSGNTFYKARFLSNSFFGINYKINTHNCQKQNKQLRFIHKKAIMMQKYLSHIISYYYAK